MELEENGYLGRRLYLHNYDYIELSVLVYLAEFRQQQRNTSYNMMLQIIQLIL